MLLRALKDVPSSVTAIKAGMQFFEPNPEQAKVWLAEKYAEPWTDRRDEWKGLQWQWARVCIMASGPSLTESQCARVNAWRSETNKVIVINTTFRMAPWADVLYGCDCRWWDCVDPKTGISYFAEARRHFDLSQMWTAEPVCAEKYGINLIRGLNQPGLSKKRGLIHFGNNSGYQAIGLAEQAGAKRLILLGYDMREDGGKTHHHGDHPAPLQSRNPYPRWIENFRPLAIDLAAAGVQVLNATPRSALDCFQKVSLADALA